jgi:hypothetical protein
MIHAMGEQRPLEPLNEFSALAHSMVAMRLGAEGSRPSLWIRVVNERHLGEDYCMPSLDVLLARTLLFTADAGNNNNLLSQPLQAGGPPFSPPSPPGGAVGPSEDQPIWSWTHDSADVTAVTGIKANVRPMGYMVMPVLERVAWGPVEIEDPSTGNPIALSLDGTMLVRRTFLPAGKLDGTDPIWRLPANVDASLLLVFAFEQDANDPSLFVLPSQASMAADDFMPDPESLAGGAPLRILVCCELILCKERADFEPLGIMAAARIHPHAMVMSNQNLARVSVTVSLQRPLTSGMSDPSMTPDIGSALFTDTNNSSARLSYFAAGINLALGVLRGPSLPPTPLWDNIFDYYRIDPPAGTAFTVVDPTLAARTVSGAIETLDLWSIVPGGSTSVNTYNPMPVAKMAGQGAYDNFHIAPKMLAGLPLLAPDPVVMAPVCAHDCLHMHWRWGAIWGAPGMSWLPKNIALNGWSANGVPYSVAGAPQVPGNQRVGIIFNGPTSIDYQADCLNVPAGAWQYVLHHGGAYSIGFAGVAEAFFDAVIPTVNLLLGSRGQPTLPLAMTSWTIVQWSIFYAVLRFQPTLLGPQERIRTVNQSLAESS